MTDQMERIAEHVARRQRDAGNRYTDAETGRFVRLALEAIEHFKSADQPPPHTGLTDVEQEARFLCERLRDLEGNIFDDEVGTEYYGHVAPSRARLEMLLAARTALDTEKEK